MIQKIQDVFNQSQIQSNAKLTTKLTDGYIKIFNQDRLVNQYNLYKLNHYINKILSHNVDYLININNTQHIANTSNVYDFDIDESIIINDYITLSLQLKLSPEMGDNLKQQYIIKLYKSIVVLTLMFLLSHVFIFYFYKKKYHNELSNHSLFLHEQKKLLEEKLQKKIWNYENNHLLDTKINKIFINEASYLSFSDPTWKQNISNEISTSIDKYNPYDIILYNSHIVEKISLKQLSQDFKRRFSVERLKVHFNSHCTDISICSKAALYQIVYSILGFVDFLFQSNTNKNNISIYVEKDSQKESLIFKFHYNESLLDIKNIEYIQASANPFIISLNRIFATLEVNNFKCYKKQKDDLYTIVISKLISLKEPNVININSHNRSMS